MHRHHCHPREVNEERIRLLERKRKAWGTEEDLLLIETADREWKEGMRKKDHIVAISPFFPHRSSEALRKRLQGLKWGPLETSRKEGDMADAEAIGEEQVVEGQRVAHPPVAIA